ncbi:hypothetical protein PseudUWO311_00540 [Pseudanabaena sp. UWO311]|uniref:AbiTii domain-containing protein n=1 Tax=Pseudanabaena sp. UWO311 TaxID=2487337 RepID=UPI0011577F61|nr:hypothetical protein [Pseudanabaena sp. UWO311]TYQ29418.1 hypothetical protein PseudUWO311_00540 [Pseudanabaena sp. UWO311]
MTTENKSTHIIELCKELLDDIELSRINSEAILLKATRLARLSGSDEIRQWLRYEMSGYNATESLSLKYMTQTGRWIDKNSNKGFWGPLAQHESTIEALKLQLITLKLDSVGGDKAYIVTHNIANEAEKIVNKVSQFSSISSRVKGLIHNFVSGIYYEKIFSGLSESIFETYKSSIDTLLTGKCNDVLEKIPSIFERLSNGESEAVSHALTTCRRIIDSFADSISPPSEEAIEIDGNTLKLDAAKHQNRINAYIHVKTDSKSRKQKLRQTLSNLYGRVSSGVHSDVSVDEAKALFLEVYLFLGEVLSLENKGD